MGKKYLKFPRLPLTLNKNQIWNYLSGFGIMFAVLSFCQELEIVFLSGYRKGLCAIVFGGLLAYWIAPIERKAKQNCHKDK